MKNPLVSIIVPTYNVQEYIKKGIDSLIDQTYSNIEILIIDDKSTDQTISVLNNNYINNRKIRLIKKDKNIGVSHSRNLGIKESKGEYIALLDGDDYYAIDKIEQQVNFMQKNKNIMLCSTYIQKFGIETNIIKFPENHLDILNLSLIGCPVAHAASMIRSSFIKKNNLLYNEELLFSEDYDFLLRIMKKGGLLCTIPQPLYFYRITGKQASFCKKENKIVRNPAQWEVSKKIHYKVFQNLIDESHTLYTIKYIDYLLKHKYVENFNEIDSFLKWSKQLIEYNQSKDEVFSSNFLIKTYQESISSYFLAKKQLSWKTLIEYITVRKHCADFKYKNKYFIKCLLFLKH